MARSTLRSRIEKAMLVAVPFVAMAAVALGLRLGASDAVRVAQVMVAPEAAAGTGVAWQVTAFEEDRGVRSPLAGAPLRVRASHGGQETSAEARTNADGVAEVRLAAPPPFPAWVEVTAPGGSVLAQGLVDPTTGPNVPRARGSGPWMPFARREGMLRIDVAVVGARVAPGFVATVGVRVEQASTQAPAPHVDVAVRDDPSIAAATSGRTDSAGWAVVHVTPVGLALMLEIAAHDAEGRTGSWAGGLVAAPGGAAIETRPRWSPKEAPEVDVIVPTARATEYVEVDDVHGRAWAAALDLDDSRRTRLSLPSLLPGVYWVVAAGAAPGTSVWTPATSLRPFFVAGADDEALALAGDGCPPRRDVRETQAALWPCLSLVTPEPAPRWMALDGGPSKRAALASVRWRGLAIALAALLLASLLEAVLVVRAAHGARARFVSALVADGDAAETGGARFPILLATCVALFVGLLGFALLAAFLARVS
ncbi:MAG: hypothetical protein FWD17_00550 [Polyangiaceae bacterium]|nr:hypothetical protein [Polyangiaceae bacterium]